MIDLDSILDGDNHHITDVLTNEQSEEVAQNNTLKHALEQELKMIIMSKIHNKIEKKFDYNEFRKMKNSDKKSIIS